jgi:hypothetical protein
MDRWPVCPSRPATDYKEVHAMNAYEIAMMLSITEREAEDIIECCETCHEGIQYGYIENDPDAHLRELMEQADWEFEYLDEG